MSDVLFHIFIGGVAGLLASCATFKVIYWRQSIRYMPVEVPYIQIVQHKLSREMQREMAWFTTQQQVFIRLAELERQYGDDEYELSLKPYQMPYIDKGEFES